MAKIKIKTIYYNTFKISINDKEFLELVHTEYQNFFINKNDDRIDDRNKSLIDIIGLNIEKMFCSKSEIVHIIQNEYCAEIKEAIEIAEEVCLHKIKLFSCPVFSYGSRIDWHKDPVTLESWELIYHEGFSKEYEKIPEDKFCMELNRQQYLLTLGKAYNVTKNDKFIVEYFSQIDDWISKNPVGMGINWRSSLEIGLREISWTYGFYYFYDSDNIYQYFDVIKKKVKYIYQQTKYIENKLSWKKYPNNHLIGEAASLVFVGLVYSFFKESKCWVEKGLNILEDQIDKQIFDDGVDKEQAVDYHRFVLDFYSQIVILCRRAGIKISENLDTRLEKMYEYMMFSMRPDGFSPMIGDDDNARVAMLSESIGRCAFSALSTGAVIFNRGDMKWVSKRYHEESLWLLGKEGYNSYKLMESYLPKQNSIAFKESGQYIMRTGWGSEDLYLYFDCGPQGMGRGGHGHADALSFELFAYGKSLIIDSGTYIYNWPDEWRNYFRGTLAHNTIVVDGVDQSEHLEPYDAFGWERKADAHNCGWYTSENIDYACGYHTGYERFPQPVRHCRDIFFVKGEYWIITDTITGVGSHSLEQLFHFAPGSVSLDNESGILKTCNKDEANILVIPVVKEGITAEVVKGCLNPIQGWVSYNYGDKIEAPVLKYYRNTLLPAGFMTILYPFRKGEDPQISVKSIKQSSEGYISSGFELQINDMRDFYLVSDSDGEQSFDNFKTDARIIYLRKEKNNQTSRIFFRNGSFLAENGIVLLQLDKTVSEFEICFNGSEAEVTMTDSVQLRLFRKDIASLIINGILQPDREKGK